MRLKAGDSGRIFKLLSVNTLKVWSLIQEKARQPGYADTAINA
jgi:hypothetical protein